MIELLFALMFVVAAQQGPPPPPPVRPPDVQVRDGVGAERKGTAVIKGHVRTVDGRPLRRARISVRGPALNNARTASTGLEGEYEVAELPAGRFTISAMRGGYLAAEYGQRAFGDDGTPIEVANGATLDKIDLTMDRAGTVSGRLTDETGEAVSGAVVLGPIGAVAGAFIGYSAGPAIARSWGIDRSGSTRQRRQASKERVRAARAEAVGGTRPAAAQVEKDARVATTRSEPAVAAPAANPPAPSATAPPVQTLE